MQSKPLFLLAFFSALLSVPAWAERSVDLHLGVAPSKSLLGIAYAQDRNEFNAGLNGLWVNSSRGYWMMPRLGYNRYFTDNGFYASLVYAPEYRNEEVTYFQRTGPGPGDYILLKEREKGWEPGVLFLGGGKSWQFTRWGIHVDAHGVTPADRDIARAWGYSIGVGGSYRFKLD